MQALIELVDQATQEAEEYEAKAKAVPPEQPKLREAYLKQRERALQRVGMWEQRISAYLDGADDAVRLYAEACYEIGKIERKPYKSEVLVAQLKMHAERLMEAIREAVPDDKERFHIELAISSYLERVSDPKQLAEAKELIAEVDADALS
jgi:hypothetical protein